MNILVQPLNTEELLLVEEWLKEQQISFERSETHFTEAQLTSIERGIEQANNGLLKPYTEVRKSAYNLLIL